MVGVHRDEMHMSVRHIEASDHHAHLLRMRHSVENRRQALHTAHQRVIRGIIEGEEIRRVLLGNDQEMPWIDRTLIQKSKGMLVFSDSIRSSFSTKQLTEGAILSQHGTPPRSRVH